MFRMTSAIDEGANGIGAASVAALNLGVVVSVRGSVVDARHVRGIALTPTQGLARGTVIEDSGGPLNAPVGGAILSRMFDVFGNTIDRGSP